MWEENPSIFFYLINSDGNLIGRFPDHMEPTLRDQHPPSGQEFVLVNNLYGKQGANAYIPSNSILKGYSKGDRDPVNQLFNALDPVLFFNQFNNSNINQNTESGPPMKNPVFY